MNKYRIIRNKIISIVASFAFILPCTINSHDVSNHSIIASAATDVSNMDATDSSYNFIKAQEGCDYECFWDNQQWTIGYGNKCPYAHTSNGVRGQKGGHTISEDQAKQLFDEKISGYVSILKSNCSGLSMTQNQFDALLSATYNHGNVLNCPLKYYLQGKYTEEQAREAYYVWCINAGTPDEAGLRARRKREADLFFSGSVITDEPIAPYPRPTGVVKSGSSGDSVKWVQHTLNFLGYDVGSVDGIFGDNTEAGVYNFQSDHGLDVDGIVGSQTIAKIVEVVTEKLNGDDIPTGSEMSSGAGQTIPDGDYYIFSAIDANYYLDVSGRECPAPSGTNVEMYESATGYPNPYDTWTVQYLNNGFYKIKQKGTTMCLDVNGADLKRGTNVQVWEENTSTAQQWSIVRTDMGYRIQSRCNSYYLDVNGAAFQTGTNVQVWEGNSSSAQTFCFVPYGPSIGQTIEDGTYTIASAVNTGYGFDVQGYDNTAYTNETNVQLWEIADGNDHFDVRYLGNGYYSICESVSGLSLDINNATPSEYLNVSKNIQMYTFSDKRNQRWIIRDAGDGYYYIISALSGYYVDLNGGIAEPRRNIAQYTYNTSNAQKWKFEKPISSPGKCDLIMRKTEALLGERVSFIGSSDTAEKFVLHVLKDGGEYKTVETLNDQCDIMFEEAGNYSAYMTAVNKSGEKNSETVSFTVSDTLRLHIDEKFELTYGVGYTYKSGNENVAVVSNSGVVTAISEGTVTITVIDEEKNTYQLKMTVSNQSIRGDCNDDGSFDVADVVLLQKWLLAVPDTHLANWKAADMCEDNRLDVFDLCMMKRLLMED